MTAGGTRGSSLGDDGIMGYVNDIAAAGALVKKALVKGKVAQGETTEIIDLLKEAVVREVPMALGDGLRYSRDDRWNALSHTLGYWRDRVLAARP